MHIKILNWRVSIERVFLNEDHLARLYDQSAHRWSYAIDRMGYIQAYDLLFQRLLEDGMLDQIASGAKVLDAGIGSGELSVALARKRPDLSWFGIDISQKMLGSAQANLKHSGDFHQASLARLPYTSESFDLVMCAHVVEHLPNPEQGLTELLRVLKPGSTFVMITTRLCPITRFLSLRWNFQPIKQHVIQESLHLSGGTEIQVMNLMPRQHFAYMSHVYTGFKERDALT
ncbi:MAG: methyltransferase domain-containing protein [Anaerolineae bacterium]